MSAPEANRPVARAGGRSVLRIVSAVVLALSALFCALVTANELRFAHQVTCGAVAPVEWRHTVTFTGLAAYALLAVPALLLLLRTRELGYAIALALGCLAFVVPVLTFLFSAFSAAMC